MSPLHVEFGLFQFSLFQLDSLGTVFLIFVRNRIRVHSTCTHGGNGVIFNASEIVTKVESRAPLYLTAAFQPSIRDRIGSDKDQYLCSSLCVCVEVIRSWAARLCRKRLNFALYHAGDHKQTKRASDRPFHINFRVLI